MSSIKKIMEETFSIDDFELEENGHDLDRYEEISKAVDSILYDYSSVDMFLHPKLMEFFNLVLDPKHNPDAKKWINDVIRTTIHNSLWVHDEYLSGRSRVTDSELRNLLQFLSKNLSDDAKWSNGNRNSWEKLNKQLDIV